jgi:hypothetical protein
MSWQLAADVRYRLVLDEAVVVRQEAAEVVGLNRVGARILELIAEGKSEEEMVAVLAAEHEVDVPVLRADVGEFVQELLAAGVIRRSDEGQGG